jgi:hypothetical protein
MQRSKGALAYLCQLILLQNKTANNLISTGTQTHESYAAYLPQLQESNKAGMYGCKLFSFQYKYSFPNCL